jgi:hypothetical protein
LPKIRFSNLPGGVWQHLLERVNERKIPVSDLHELRAWAKDQPFAPDGDWYKDFGSFKLCGSGQYPKTFLTRGMKPYGQEIQ